MKKFGSISEKFQKNFRNNMLLLYCKKIYKFPTLNSNIGLEKLMYFK
nr:MAG TPA: hypothetical protein [Caudoviricetes sp.]